MERNKTFQRLHRTGLVACFLLTAIVLVYLYLSGGVPSLWLLLWGISVGLALTVVLAGAFIAVNRRWRRGERGRILADFLLVAGICFGVLLALDCFHGQGIAWGPDVLAGAFAGLARLDEGK